MRVHNSFPCLLCVQTCAPSRVCALSFLCDCQMLLLLCPSTKCPFSSTRCRFSSIRPQSAPSLLFLSSHLTTFFIFKSPSLDSVDDCRGTRESRSSPDCIGQVKFVRDRQRTSRTGPEYFLSWSFSPQRPLLVVATSHPFSLRRVISFRQFICAGGRQPVHFASHHRCWEPTAKTCVLSL